MGSVIHIPNWAAGRLYEGVLVDPPRLTKSEIRAGVALGAGLVTAASIVLAARGRTTQAYILGASGAVVSAFFTAIRVLNEE